MFFKGAGILTKILKIAYLANVWQNIVNCLAKRSCLFCGHNCKPEVERLYLKYALPELNYSDNRSFKKWCSNNGVEIFCDFGSNKRYVLKEDFEKAKSGIQKRVIEHTKSFLTTSMLNSPSYNDAPMEKKPCCRYRQ
jgi:hypothetical protein